MQIGESEILIAQIKIQIAYGVLVAEPDQMAIAIQVMLGAVKVFQQLPLGGVLMVLFVPQQGFVIKLVERVSEWKVICRLQSVLVVASVTLGL